MKNKKTVVGLTLVALLIFSGVVSSCIFGSSWKPKEVFYRRSLIEHPYLLSGEFGGATVLTFQKQEVGCRTQQPLGLMKDVNLNVNEEYEGKYKDTRLNKEIHKDNSRWRFPDGYPTHACLSTIEKVSIVSNCDFEGYPAGSELSPIAVFEILSVKDFILGGGIYGSPVQKHIIRGNDAEGWKNLELFNAEEFLLHFDKCVSLPKNGEPATLTVTFSAGDVVVAKDPSQPISGNNFRRASGVEISRTFRVELAR